MAEGTFSLHATPLMYARRALPANITDKENELLNTITTRVTSKCREDLDWLETQLKAQQEQGSKFLVGNGLTAADVMMGLSVGLVLERVTAVNERGERHKSIESWIGGLRGQEGFKRAMERLDFKR